MSDNPDELFDIVDTVDQVIGKERRGIVHATGMLHRAVHILVQNSSSEIFVQKRSMSKDSNPGRWDSSASGHLDSGEDYDTAAVRELEEELGIQVEALKRIARLDASPETGNEFVWIYRACHEGPFQLHPTEISDGRWVSKKHLQEWMEERPDEFPSCFQVVWKAAAAHLS